MPSQMQRENLAGHGEATQGFVTDHLALASYLLTRGHRPSLAVTHTGKVSFEFNQTADLDSDIAAFHSGAALVEPNIYDAARLALRRQIEELKGGVRSGAAGRCWDE
jgi:hypothetical protein